MQDYVVVTLKAHGLPAAAPAIATMMGPDSALVTGDQRHARTGISMASTARSATGVVESVDPGGTLWSILPPSQAIGCVVYPGGRGGRARRDRTPLRRPVHPGRAGRQSRSPRVEAFAKALIAAGLKAPVRPRIRDELWVKLWGNLAFNPISALTGATLDRHHRAMTDCGRCAAA